PQGCVARGPGIEGRASGRGTPRPYLPLPRGRHGEPAGRRVRTKRCGFHANSNYARSQRGADNSPPDAALRVLWPRISPQGSVLHRSRGRGDLRLLPGGGRRAGQVGGPRRRPRAHPERLGGWQLSLLRTDARGVWTGGPRGRGAGDVHLQRLQPPGSQPARSYVEARVASPSGWRSAAIWSISASRTGSSSSWGTVLKWTPLLKMTPLPRPPVTPMSA